MCCRFILPSQKIILWYTTLVTNNWMVIIKWLGLCIFVEKARHVTQAPLLIRVLNKKKTIHLVFVAAGWLERKWARERTRNVEPFGSILFLAVHLRYISFWYEIVYASEYPTYLLISVCVRQEKSESLLSENHFPIPSATLTFSSFTAAQRPPWFRYILPFPITHY